MSFKALLALSLFPFACCMAAQPELTAQESALASAAGIDPSIALRVRAFGISMERLMAKTPDYGEAPAAGIIIGVKAETGLARLLSIRSALAGTAYHAYLRDDAFGSGPDKIAVVKTGDYGYLEIVGTDAVNYDLDHAAILERYKQWDKKYGLKLVGAGGDWLEVELEHRPGDWQAFAAEVYEFCPDSVDQGAGDVESLARELKDGNAVYLWWD
jgi:Domain of unknown function (DUF4253)